MPTRCLGDLTEAERREIELEENLRRLDLTAKERSRTLVAGPKPCAGSCGKKVAQILRDLRVRAGPLAPTLTGPSLRGRKGGLRGREGPARTTPGRTAGWRGC